MYSGCGSDFNFDPEPGVTVQATATCPLQPLLPATTPLLLLLAFLSHLQVQLRPCSSPREGNMENMLSLTSPDHTLASVLAAPSPAAINTVCPGKGWRQHVFCAPCLGMEQSPSWSQSCKRKVSSGG